MKGFLGLFWLVLVDYASWVMEDPGVRIRQGSVYAYPWPLFIAYGLLVAALWVINRGVLISWVRGLAQVSFLVVLSTTLEAVFCAQLRPPGLSMELLLILSVTQLIAATMVVLGTHGKVRHLIPSPDARISGNASVHVDS